MCICDMPDTNVLISWACGLRASVIHTRQIPHPHVTSCHVAASTYYYVETVFVLPTNVVHEWKIAF